MREPELKSAAGVIEYRTHYAWAFLVATLLALALTFRFFQLQILRGDEYERRSRVDHVARERIPARRGVIKDRKGTILAQNVSEYSLTVVPHYLERRPETLPRLRALLGLTEDAYREIAARVQQAMTAKRRYQRITLLRDLVSDRCPHDKSPLELSQANTFLRCPACGAHYEHLTADLRHCHACGGALEREIDRDDVTCSRCGTTYVTGATCPADGAMLEERTARLICPTCKRGFEDEAAIVKAHLHELPGLEIDTRLRREYPQRFRLSHVLGYVNEANPADLEREPGVYLRGDTVGRGGVERALETLLRGTSGELVYFRDQSGRREIPADMGRTLSNLRSVPATAGETVWLTVDLGVQRIAEQALRYYPSGAAVVLEVHTGRVLALYSKPGYDPNVWSGRLTSAAKAEYDANPYGPMLNKAIIGYAPGSVYKVVAALAGLEEGVFDAQTVVHCPGYYEFGGRRFRCHKRSGHGDVNLHDAIKHSCDVYFYILAEQLGMDRLERYAHELFELGGPTGIEIREQVGRVPSREWHRTHSPIGWQPGFTLSTALGQGAVLTTPLQVARMYAALAARGALPKVRIALQYESEDGTVTRRFMPEVARQMAVAPEHLELVHQALVAVVQDDDGTGTPARVAGLRIAGKTGTAEAHQSMKGASPEFAEWLKKDHAWFAAYAPADDPQIVVVVFLEHGGAGGKDAGPVTRRIIDRYFREGYGRLPELLPEDTEIHDPSETLDGIR